MPEPNKAKPNNLGFSDGMIAALNFIALFALSGMRIEPYAYMITILVAEVGHLYARELFFKNADTKATRPFTTGISATLAAACFLTIAAQAGWLDKASTWIMNRLYKTSASEIGRRERASPMLPGPNFVLRGSAPTFRT